MAKIVNEVGLSRTQKYPNYSVTMSWDRDCCVYRTVIIIIVIRNVSMVICDNFIVQPCLFVRMVLVFCYR